MIFLKSKNSNCLTIKLQQNFSVLSIFLFCFNAYAQDIANTEIIKSGTCGTNCSYTLNNLGVLNVFPTDKTKSDATFTTNSSDLIGNTSVKEVVVQEGITALGTYGAGYLYAAEKISLPNTLKSIGSWSFISNRGLSNVLIPDSVTSIATGGENGGYWNAFLNTGSTKFYCSGHLMNQCKTAALYQNTALVHYEIASDGTYIIYQGDTDTVVGAYSNLDDIVANRPVESYIMKDKDDKVTAKYDGRGNVLENYFYDAGGSIVKILDKNGKKIFAKQSYTIKEANDATPNPNGRYSIRFSW